LVFGHVITHIVLQISIFLALLGATMDDSAGNLSSSELEQRKGSLLVLAARPVRAIANCACD